MVVSVRCFWSGSGAAVAVVVVMMMACGGCSVEMEVVCGDDGDGGVVGVRLCEAAVAVVVVMMMACGGCSVEMEVSMVVSAVEMVVRCGDDGESDGGVSAGDGGRRLLVAGSWSEMVERRQKNSNAYQVGQIYNSPEKNMLKNINIKLRRLGRGGDDEVKMVVTQRLSWRQWLVEVVLAIAAVVTRW
nr:hypothetical protein [Tanacetum cinerariifolium]